MALDSRSAVCMWHSIAMNIDFIGEGPIDRKPCRRCRSTVLFFFNGSFNSKGRHSLVILDVGRV